MRQISADSHIKEYGPNEELYILQDNLGYWVTMFLFLGEWVIEMGYL